MSETNKSYRIRTKVGGDTNINVNINQNFDILEVLSLKISTDNIYKLHTANYGCVVGRVLANGGVGVPNAKISIFIEANEDTKSDEILNYLYPYTDVSSKNEDKIRYNLLPYEKVTTCHQDIGTMPNKRMVLDDSNVLEIFDTYYKYTTTTNESGDYMIFGVPVGQQTVHMDLDLSDIGFLSQKPIDLFYKGYVKTQFENPSQFKKDTNLDGLAQVISQNNSVYVYPFWGDNSGENIKITRCDIDVNYKFEPTCIFMGSMVTDDKSNGFSKRCIPTRRMGRMDRLTSGNGTIEMIRKRPDGKVEEFSVMGNELIDGNGTWCYQIPMNLDYVVSDEYGNLVPTDDPEKGIPTRTRVRFRISLNDTNSEYANNHICKVLVPHNPEKEEKIDYVFGTKTVDEDDGTGSYRDLFWNNVYTVKSYIPRIQKGNYQRNERFSGFKNVNVFNDRNPIPYNNMRVNITFMFVLQCAIIKSLIFFCTVYNWFMEVIPGLGIYPKHERKCAYIGDGLCPDLEGWYFAPRCNLWSQLNRTMEQIKGDVSSDPNSADIQNKEEESVCLTNKMAYFNQCVEINLAMENEVIQFDFYNDWINGLLYLPRWFVKIRKKKNYLFGLIKIKEKVSGCLEETYGDIRYLTQQCALGYTPNEETPYIFNTITSHLGCKKDNSKQKCHKTSGRKKVWVFGYNGGIVYKKKNIYDDLSVYYPRPCEWRDGKKRNLFATDIVLLGNINPYNKYGIPSDFDGLTSSTFQLPPNMVQTTMDTEGPLYALGSGKHVCSNTTVMDPITKLEPTLKNYQDWSQGQEFYDTDAIKTGDYELTEMSGIDWGYSGPNQGGNDVSKLYQPGGHFLGIGCTNAEVNIKSCVNLSRICEIGAMMSQRHQRISIDDSGNTKYTFIIPTGLIAKEEISDSNYRNIFSTLNHNRLKTIVETENGFRKYDFISVTPINFRGELYKFTGTGTPYNTNTLSITGHPDEEKFITYESNSSDYYDFRMGLRTDSEKDPKVTRSKHLIENGNSVSMPVYENSYYFYFGIKDGNTAMDRFLSDYYSECPNTGEIIEPTIEVINVPKFSLCDDEVKSNNDDETKIEIKVNGLNYPYKYTVFNNDKNEKVVESEKYDSENIKINVDGEGTYVITVENGLQGISLNTSVNIYKDLGDNEDKKNNIGYSDINISSKDYNITPYIYIKDYTATTLNNVSGGTITVEIPEYIQAGNGPYVVGLSIDDGNFYTSYVDGDIFNHEYANNEYYPSNCSTFYELLANLSDGYEGISCNVEVEKNKKIIIDDSEINVVTTTFKVWGDGEYNIKLIYSCKPFDGYDGCIDINDYLIGTVNIGVLNRELDFYFYDESLTLSELKARDYVTDNKLNLSKAFSSGSTLSENEKMMLKKTFIFNKSKYDTNKTFSGEIYPVGGKIPYKEITSGHGEYVDLNNIIEISENSYSDTISASEEGYVLDIHDMYMPTIDYWSDEKGVLKKNGYELTITDKNNNIRSLKDINFYYAPFFYNAVLWAENNNSLYFKYRIANGVSQEIEKGTYYIGDMELKINNNKWTKKGVEDTKLNGKEESYEENKILKNYRNIDEIVNLNEANVDKVIITNDNKELSMKLSNGKKYNISFSVSEYNNYNTNTIDGECIFYNTISTINGSDNKKHLRRTGISSKGVRYYWVESPEMLKTALNGEEEDQITAWNSIFTNCGNNKEGRPKLYYYEITNHLTNVNNTLELPWPDEYTGNTIIGLYDEYTKLDGVWHASLGQEGDYAEEVNNPGSIIPKDTSILSFVKIYDVKNPFNTVEIIIDVMTGITVSNMNGISPNDEGNYDITRGGNASFKLDYENELEFLSVIEKKNDNVNENITKETWDIKDKWIRINNIQNNITIHASILDNNDIRTISITNESVNYKDIIIIYCNYNKNGVKGSFAIFKDELGNLKNRDIFVSKTTTESITIEYVRGENSEEYNVLEYIINNGDGDTEGGLSYSNNTITVKTVSDNNMSIILNNDSAEPMPKTERKILLSLYNNANENIDTNSLLMKVYYKNNIKGEHEFPDRVISPNNSYEEDEFEDNFFTISDDDSLIKEKDAWKLIFESTNNKKYTLSSFSTEYEGISSDSVSGNDGIYEMEIHSLESSENIEINISCSNID